MPDLIIPAFYFFLPAYFANMCPVIAGKLKLPLGRPISERFLGSHKTWRGFYAGYLGALAILAIQLLLQKEQLLTPYTLLDYQNINLFGYAFLFGIGAIIGDTLKSFFKRCIGIKPGAPWFPFDQLDFVIIALLFLWPFYTIPWPHILVLLIATPVLHLLVNILAYKLGLKKVWW